MTKTFKLTATTIAAINTLIDMNESVAAQINTCLVGLEGCDDIRPHMVQLVANRNSLQTRVGQNGLTFAPKKGEKIPGYERAKSQLDKIMSQLSGKAPSAEMDIPADVRKLALQILAMENKLQALCEVHMPDAPSKLKNAALATVRAEAKAKK